MHFPATFTGLLFASAVLALPKAPPAVDQKNILLEGPLSEPTNATVRVEFDFAEGGKPPTESQLNLWYIAGIKDVWKCKRDTGAKLKPCLVSKLEIKKSDGGLNDLSHVQCQGFRDYQAENASTAVFSQGKPAVIPSGFMEVGSVQCVVID